VPALCGRLRCGVCRPRQARRMELALGTVRIERRVVLSAVGDDWNTVRQRVKRLASSLRRDLGAGWEWWWVCERNPKLTGHHVHALVRGPFVQQSRLQELCSREGMGIPWIGVWRPERVRGRAGAYEFKGLVGAYELKGASGDHLALNGQRLAHWSRGWWGQPYRALLKGMVGDGGDPGPWVREKRPVPF
jgi:hypothetical protein